MYQPYKDSRPAMLVIFCPYNKAFCEKEVKDGQNLSYVSAIMLVLNKSDKQEGDFSRKNQACLTNSPDK